MPTFTEYTLHLTHCGTIPRSDPRWFFSALKQRADTRNIPIRLPFRNPSDFEIMISKFARNQSHYRAHNAAPASRHSTARGKYNYESACGRRKLTLARRGWKLLSVRSNFLWICREVRGFCEWRFSKFRDCLFSVAARVFLNCFLHFVRSCCVRIAFCWVRLMVDGVYRIALESRVLMKLFGWDWKNCLFQFTFCSSNDLNFGLQSYEES